MSTYNGEKYVREQIESIFSQRDVNFHLLIRDDGSSDATVSILHEFKREHSEFIEIIQGENIGWKKSFFTLLRLASQKYKSYAYYAFADQDDIWLPQKLIRAIDKLEKFESEPTLYFSNLTYYKDGIILDNIRNNQITISYKNCLIRNYATGCTIVFNQQLLNVATLDSPNIDIPHDYWLYIVGCLCGQIIFDNESHILYRQHENSQIGYKYGFLEIWKRRLKSISTLLSKQNKDLVAGEILRIYGDSLNNDAKNSIIKLSQYSKSLKNRMALLLDNEYSYNNKSSDFWLKLRIILGKL